MTDPSAEFRNLLQRVRVGNPAAWQELWRTFDPRLLGMLRRRCRGRKSLHRLGDADDLSQDVWLKFFAELLGTHDFATPEALASYLAAVGESSLRAMVRRYLGAGKRKLARDQSLDAPAGAASRGKSRTLPATPDRSAAYQEECDDFLQRQRKTDRPALALLLQGWSVAETAEKLGQSASTVRRSRSRVTSGYQRTETR